MKCQVAGECGGCDLILEPFERQKSIKTDELARIASAFGFNDQIEFEFGEFWRMRDRVDLTFQAAEGVRNFGLYGRSQQGLLDLTSCPMMSDRLEAWYLEFRNDPPPLPSLKGSIRLRVAPDNTRGVWIDFSNEKIKELLDEKDWLTRLTSKAYVEVGQKRKRLVLENGEFNLLKIHSYPWFETYLHAGPHPLHCHIGSFTQPAFVSNRVLVQKVVDMVKRADCSTWIELGAGIGNFTLPLAEQTEQVIALENDTYAVAHLKRNVQSFRGAHKISVQAFDFQNSSKQEKFFSTKNVGLLVDPPRSGLGKFVERIREFPTLPSSIVYVSCYPESFLTDAKRLNEMFGYQLKKIVGVDQFPQSRHFEVVALIQL